MLLLPNAVNDTYPVQDHLQRPISIQRGPIAPQLANLAQDADGGVRELLEVGRRDARRSFSHAGYSRVM